MSVILRNNNSCCQLIESFCSSFKVSISLVIDKLWRTATVGNCWDDKYSDWVSDIETLALKVIGYVGKC